MSDFWTELLSLSGTKLQFTTAYHPQTDGQSEVTNRALEQYLRAFTFEQPKKWFEFLPWAELAMNCSTNVSIGMSPFKALYGRDPPNVFGSPARPSNNGAVAEILGERTVLLQLLKQNLARAQRRMAESANKHRKQVEFQVGDRVLLRLQPYRQVSIGRPLSAKLSRRFYGPFIVTERIGAVAYRLQLPLQSRIHDVFHVSLLKAFTPPLSESAIQQLPTNFKNGRPIDVPVSATAERTVLLNGLPQCQWLVHWSSDPSTPAWVPKTDLLRHFPSLGLEDKAIVKEGGVDRDSNKAAAEQEDRRQHELDAENVEQPEPAEVDRINIAEDVERPEPAEAERRNVIAKSERPKRKTTKPARYRDF